MDQPRPDYAYWDTVDPVELQHAAWLWCDLEPPPGAFQKGGEATWPGKVLAAETAICRETNSPPAHVYFGTLVASQMTAPRSQLRDLAGKLGVAPPFLFPELRDQPVASTPAPSPVEPPLHESERATLLKIIRALAELHGIKPTGNPDDAYRSEATRLLQKCSSKAIAAPCTDKTLAKHLKAAFDSR